MRVMRLQTVFSLNKSLLTSCIGIGVIIDEVHCDLRLRRRRRRRRYHHSSSVSSSLDSKCSPPEVTSGAVGGGVVHDDK